MNQRKPNTARWYALGLAVVLVAGCLVMSVGVTWARYRTDVNKGIFFQARKPLAVHLGTVEETEEGSVFLPTGLPNWETADGKLMLDLAVANGTSAETFETNDQCFHIRLIGSLGAWSGEETAAVYLVIPPAEEPAAEETEPESNETAEEPTEEPAAPVLVKATAVRIEPKTPLWNTFGDGWIFRFLDEQTGEELVWTLEGGGLSYLDLDLAIEGGTLTDTSLLQLQIVQVSGGA